MKTEKTIMITGKQYTNIKAGLDENKTVAFNNGSANHPEVINITDIYLDTDPDFTRNPRQFARINDDMRVQVKIEFEAED